jgi:hypothetical protein
MEGSELATLIEQSLLHCEHGSLPNHVYQAMTKPHMCLNVCLPSLLFVLVLPQCQELFLSKLKQIGDVLTFDSSMLNYYKS